MILKLLPTDRTWDAVLKGVYTSCICAKHELLQCKILNQAHWDKERFPNMDSACNCCTMIPSSHLHTFWNCSKLAIYWTLAYYSPFWVPSDVYSLNLKLQCDFLAFCTALLLASHLIHTEMERCSSSISYAVDQDPLRGYLILYGVRKN